MDFFDSPLFWIVVIWWLLSTFLGAKARKRRAMQRLAEQESELPTTVETDEVQFDLEDQEEAVRSVTVAAEEKIPEPTQPPTVGDDRNQIKAGPPRKAPIPKPPLEQLARTLGIPKEFIPSGIIAAEEEPAAEVEGAAEPVGSPEKEITETALATPVPDASYQSEETQAAIETTGGITHLQESVFPSLTPLQQAIVLKEILDRPRPFRRGIR
jgi:hypothetical protein